MNIFTLFQTDVLGAMYLMGLSLGVLLGICITLCALDFRDTYRKHARAKKISDFSKARN